MSLSQIIELASWSAVAQVFAVWGLTLAGAFLFGVQEGIRDADARLRIRGTRSS